MNILLCCAAGMSTSLLVTKMEKSAAEKGMKCKIWAVPGDAVRNHINDADVLLLGSQVRYMLPELKKLGEANHVPVGVINYKGCEERAEEKRSGTTMANGALGDGDDHHF
ncbi:PTS system lichenan oligosaccharide-specific IIB component (Lac family) [Thermolongibacillus altinsuensis]|uniref:PTS system lichenan oligosaccharide-specific IIB component (Lac family) n=1 Tax=Thermolongibacillus altinsuensis TaxID=575256 RepID=A0A4R1QEI7_9BACL|nr:PTS system lichenan oligosaccharide-specific IIB component (Lac family) [Thermolongibacillus altinsuensis]